MTNKQNIKCLFGYHNPQLIENSTSYYCVSCHQVYAWTPTGNVWTKSSDLIWCDVENIVIAVKRGVKCD